MIVFWTENAKNDLVNYKQNSKIITPQKVENYINSLIEYVDTLNEFHELGKFLFNIEDFEIRQLIYHKHKIFYALHSNKIYILVVSHTSRNPKEIIKTIKSYFNNKK